MQLHDPQFELAPQDAWAEKPPAGFNIDIDNLLAIAKRQWRVVVIAMLVAFALGIGYLLTAKPLYTAKSSLLIDRDTSKVVDQLSTIGNALNNVLEDDGMVLSQVELLKSDTIGLAVVDALKLPDDPEFNASSGSPVAAVKKMVVSLLRATGLMPADTAAQDAESKRQAALETLGDSVNIERVDRSYVLDVSYTSPSPNVASKIANAISDAYLTDKLNSKYEATRRASEWLLARIDELRQKSLASDLAVQKFRTANGLVATGGTPGAAGVLVQDQQLTELNSQLIAAQAQMAQSQAKYDRIKSIIDSGNPGAIVSDVLASQISNELRGKFLDASKREAELSARLGPDHEQAVRLRNEMKEYQRLLFEELTRISQSYQSELDVAKARVKTLTDSVASATGASATANETQVQLRELEREADTYKNLYQTFLQRYQEAIQQQSFPITEARVINRATPPDSPSKPKVPLSLALALVAGFAAGTGIGAFREFRDRFFRTGQQVRDVLGLEFLGIAPLVEGEELVAGAEPAAADLHPRAIRKPSVLADYVIEHPLSAFAETLRGAKIAADLHINHKSKVIGIVSTLPGEGKSTVAINFAELLASQGARTLLIDADLRNPGATRALGRHADAGVLEAVLSEKPVQDLLLLNPKTRLAFLPAVVTQRIPHSAELLASGGMAQLLSTATAQFDYVILDLPPLGPVVDARAVASKVDGFIVVVEWGKTARNVVRQTLGTDPIIAEKCLGVILNKVDTEKLKLYREFGSSEYYYSRYSSYYQTSAAR